MTHLPPGALHLISEWFIKPGCEEEVDRELIKLADEVQAGEPGTLIYMPHRPRPNTPTLQALPPVDLASVLFFEVYRDEEAFHRHVTGPIFTRFVAECGHLFVNANRHPYTTVEFMRQAAGFIR